MSVNHTASVPGRALALGDVPAWACVRHPSMTGHGRFFGRAGVVPLPAWTSQGRGPRRPAHRGR